MNNKEIMTGILIAGFAVLSTGCTTTGTGEGELNYKNADSSSTSPVKFTWKSSDTGQQGTMTATLKNDVYRGPFFQITAQTKDSELFPLWEGWEEGWGGWPYPYEDSAYITNYTTYEYITQYSGKVVANLKDADGHRMRCRFFLTVPSMGMTDGGEGECQLSDGSSINATFDAT